MKKLLQILVVVLFVVVGAQIVSSQKAEAATQGYFTCQYNDHGGGDFVLPQNFTSSSLGGPAAISDSTDTVAKFEAFIENYYDNGTTWEKIGAANIMDSMINLRPSSSGACHSTPSDIKAQWEAKISQFISDGGFVQWDNSFSYCINSMNLKDHNNAGDSDPDDVGLYNSCSSSTPITESHTIKFIINDGSGNKVIYAIKRRCANPVGGLKFNYNKKTHVIDWSLSGNSTSDWPTTAPGQARTFRHSVWNDSGDPATYSWKVRYQTSTDGGNTWTSWADVGCSSGCSGTVGSPGTSEGSRDPAAITNAYTFPATAPNGEIYCQDIWFTNSDGPGSDPDISFPKACTTYRTTTQCAGDNDSNFFTPPPGCSASCTINSIAGSGPGGIVVDGDHPKMNVTLTNTNTSDLPESVNTDKHLSILEYIAKGNADGTDYTYNYHAIDRTSFETVQTSSSITFDIIGYRAASGGSYAFHATPTYDGAYFLWNDGTNVIYCDGSAKVYKPFNTSVHASTNMATEDPRGGVAYHSWIANESSTPEASVPITSSFYKQGGSTYATGNGNYSAGPGATKDVLNSTYTPATVTDGDTYCTVIHTDHKSGYVGPDGVGDVVYNNDPDDASSCPRVHNAPYFHAFGADVSAGGGFGTNCVNAAGSINANTRTVGAPGQPAGSGVQIGALAIGPIYGFSSANLRSSAPQGSAGLSFGNQNITTTSGDAPYLGGNLGGEHCVPDYYSKKPVSATTPGTTQVGSMHGANYFGSSVTLNSAGAASIANNENISIFVNGDVIIKNNIAFANANAVGGYGGIENVPSVYIIAKGNIYIDPAVKQLDGMYVAQPTDRAGTNKGYIYSCASNTTPYSDPALKASWLGSCRNQLVVNGAFVAQHVRLLRTFGSLRDSLPGEYYGSSRPSGCSDSGSTTLGDCAAEIFNFSPELFLAQPSITPSGGPTTGTYQYITSLSPVL